MKERQKLIRSERDRIEWELREICGDVGEVLDNLGTKKGEWWADVLETRTIFYFGQLKTNRDRCQNSFHRRKNKTGKCPDCSLKSFNLDDF